MTDQKEEKSADGPVTVTVETVTITTGEKKTEEKIEGKTEGKSGEKSEKKSEGQSGGKSEEKSEGNVAIYVKTLDANKYATKKTVAQGMLDIALLTSNASQLKYVLQVGPKHEFYTLLVVLISISIVLQVVSAIVAVALGSININTQHGSIRKAEILNDTTVGFKLVSISLNVVISVLYTMDIDAAALAANLAIAASNVSGL